MTSQNPNLISALRAEHEGLCDESQDTVTGTAPGCEGLTTRISPEAYNTYDGSLSVSHGGVTVCEPSVSVA